MFKEYNVLDYAKLKFMLSFLMQNICYRKINNLKSKIRNVIN